jgi:hypothetical protein
MWITLFFTEVKGVVIARQDFESSPAAPVWTFTTTNIGTPGGGTGFSSSTSGTGDSPASANLFSEGARGYRVQGPTSGSVRSGRIFNFAPINTCGYENLQVSFRVSAMSIGSNSNGIDINDDCIISISPDGGITYFDQIKITGTTTSNQSRWAFTSTGSSTRIYSTSAFTEINPPNGLSNTAPSTITITDLPSVSDLRIRIILAANAANESWIIDDLKLTGDNTFVSGFSVCPSDPITGLNYLLGSGPSKEKSFQLLGNGLSPANGTVTISAPTNFEVASNPTGPYGSTINIPYTGGNLSPANYYVRLNAGLPVNTYSGNINISNGTITTTMSVSGAVRQDLFFSEYVEGTGNNKYIEIFNPTGSTVALSNYRVSLFTNGNPVAVSSLTLPNINLLPCSTYVIGNVSGSIYSPDITSAVTNYNGNDALVLFNISTGDTLDIFGRVGEDPGTAWTSGGFSTLDKTLVRRPEVMHGIYSNPLSGFPTLSTQWIQYNTNENRLLGNHGSTICGNTIETLALTAPAPYCAGEILPVSFNSLGTFNSGNQFRVELSDENGLFGSPTLMSGSLSLSGVNPSGTVNAVIPSVSVTSGNYRVRVISTNPVSQTIINPPGGFTLTDSATIANVSNLSFSNTSGEITLSWILPSGCFDEIMVVVTSASGITFSPTGNGNLYTANPVFAGFNQVVFKGTATGTTITNLSDGTVYYFEIFTRLGTTWSSGIEIAAMPDRYCLPTISNLCDEYIYNVQLNTINNTTTEGCGFNGYSSFINQNTTLVKGQTYTINVGVGIVGDGIDISYLNDDIRIWIDYDQDGLLENNVTERIINLNNNGAAGAYSFTVPLTVPTGSTRLRIRIVYDNEASACGTSTYGETEDYTVNIVEPCTPNATISNFYPTSGPAGTEVRITGSNLNLVTAVSFNNIPASSFQILDAANILAIVPDGSGVGRIRIADDVACLSVSSSNFTEITSPVNCAGSYPDLFISEVVDPNAGNNHYVEIYNGTGATVNLSSPFSYSLRTGNRINPGDNPIYSTIGLTGSIPHGETRVYYFGTNTANLATGTQLNNGSGYNTYDDVELLKNGIPIDYYYTGNTTSFSARRRNDVTAPDTTFNATDWDLVTPTSTDNLSIFNATPPFEITSQPVILSTCPLILQFTTNSTGLTYQWRYNNNRGNNTTWVDLNNGPGTGPFAGTTIIGADDTILTIAGDLTNIHLYQFYCMVSDDSCNKPTQALQYSYTPGLYWKAKASGNWNDANIWQNAPTPSGPWNDACTYPTLTNSDSVVISSSYTVDVPIGASVGAGKLYIDLSSKLQIATTGILEIANLSGTDLILEGTLEDNSTSGNGLFLNNGATWRMGSAAELIKTGNSVVTKYRDQYEGGIINIPSSAIWRYRKVSPTNPPILSANMFYPNLFFENFSNTSYIQTTSSAFQGASPCIIKGDLNIGMSGDPLTARSQNTNSGLLQIRGNLNIGTGSTFINVDGANIGTGFDIKGNINNSGTLSTNRRLRLSGDSTQIIEGAGTFFIDTLITDKLSGSLVDLRRDLTVNQQIQFGTGGIIQTGNYTISIANGDVFNAVIGFETPNGTGQYNDDKYVFGKLSRRIANGSTDTYVYPIGDAPPPGGIGYNPARLQIVSTPNNNTVTGSFIASSPGTINVFRKVLCDTTFRIINHVGFTGLGYWRMDGSNTTQYNIWLHPNELNLNTNPNFDIDSLGFVNNYRALKEDNSKAGLPWDPDVVEAGDPCVVSTNYYQIPGFGYTGFSIFAPGGGGTALPVELISFTSTCSENGVELFWSTASEFNSDYFVVERSQDGINFTALGKVNASGFSNTIQRYNFTDRDNQQGLSYYRILEVDFDGREYLYPIITSECIQLKNASIRVFYVPGEGIVAQWEQFRSGNVSFVVYDASGRQVNSKLFSTQPGTNRERITDGSTLAQGIYMISMQDGERVLSAKVFVP